ncbi:hypothetical protein G6F43_001286 [Rhizopus delemar]|nr:hypothetical protein G6F43_001286 [Rhizopus delemar]
MPSPDPFMFQQNIVNTPTMIDPYLLQQMGNNRIIANMPFQQPTPMPQAPVNQPMPQAAANSPMSLTKKSKGSNNTQQQAPQETSNPDPNDNSKGHLFHTIRPSPVQPNTASVIHKKKDEGQKPLFGFEKDIRMRQECADKYSALTVTGYNVSPDNIADGYVQFLIYHDSQYMGNIESVMNARRKISAVPKTNIHGINYTTWDLYCLIYRLHKRQIKNWSQLVSILGLENVSGRAQFAQRIKRWMHKYKVDCYFNYLLGNDYDFYDPDSIRNKSILSVNPSMKRKGKEKEEAAEGEELEPVAEVGYLKEDDADEVDEYEQKSIPLILPPGGRKRLKLNDDPEKYLQVAKSFIKRRKHDDSDTDESDDDDGNGDKSRMNDSDKKNGKDKKDIDDEKDGDKKDKGVKKDADDNKSNANGQHNEEVEDEWEFENGIQIDNMSDREEQDQELEEEDDQKSDENISIAEENNENIRSYTLNRKAHNHLYEDEDEDGEDELEDELESTASSVVSPDISRAEVPKNEEIKLSKPCSNCDILEAEVTSLKKEIANLKSYISIIEENLSRQKEATETSQKYINQLLLEKLKLRGHYTKWRQKLAKDILNGPVLPEEEEEEEEEGKE